MKQKSYSKDVTDMLIDTVALLIIAIIGCIYVWITDDNKQGRE